jgi:hypothetical protein
MFPVGATRLYLDEVGAKTDCGKRMLLVDMKWVERDPVMRAFAKPFEALQSVCWTDENQSFWVLPRPNSAATEFEMAGWLISDAAVLLKLCQQLGEDNVSVHVLRRTQAGVQLVQIKRILREEGKPRGRLWLWYETEDGTCSPCAKLILDQTALPLLVHEARFLM